MRLSGLHAKPRALTFCFSLALSARVDHIVANFKPATPSYLHAVELWRDFEFFGLELVAAPRASTLARSRQVTSKFNAQHAEGVSGRPLRTASAGNDVGEWHAQPVA